MAVQILDNAVRLVRTNNFGYHSNTGGGYTVGFWVRVTEQPDDSSYLSLWYLHNADYSQYVGIFGDFESMEVKLFVSNGIDADVISDGFTLTVDKWHYIDYSKSGKGANTKHYFAVDGVLVGPGLTMNMDSTIFNPTTMGLGNDTFGNWNQLKIAHFRELKYEESAWDSYISSGRVPFSTHTNWLQCLTPFDEDLNDISTNNTHWTALDGSVSFVDDSPSEIGVPSSPKVWELDLSPGPSEWLQGYPTTKGFFERFPPTLDPPDPNYLTFDSLVELEYRAGAGPNGEACLDADDQVHGGYLAWSDAALLVRPVQLVGHWNATRGHYRVWHYIDEQVKAEAFYLIPFALWTNSLFFSAIYIGMWEDDDLLFFDLEWPDDEDGYYWTEDGMPWSFLMDKWNKFEVIWDFGDEGVRNGYIKFLVNDQVIFSVEGVETFPNRFEGEVPSWWFASGFYGLPGKIPTGMMTLYDSEQTVEPPDEEEEFVPDGSFGPLLWIEFDDPVLGATRVFAKVDLNDPDEYYHGFKEGKILRLDRVVRALSSDDDGSLEGQSWGAEFDDSSYYWRGILGRGDLKRLITNRNVRLRMISNPGRLAQEIPRTVALGLIRAYETD